MSQSKQINIIQKLIKDKVVLTGMTIIGAVLIGLGVKKFYFDKIQTKGQKIEEKNTLFEKLGGEGAISAVVDKFYEFMMADPVVKDFFANVDMKNQAQMQKNFLGMVTGGPNKYTGKDMKAGHLHLKIGNKEFDATWKHLQSALNHFKVPQNLIGEVKQIFYSVEEDIVTIKQKTLFEKLGGEGAISAVVDKFYEFMMADPVVKDFFANVDMKNQAQMQKNFLGMVTGGPNKYTGKDMKAGHLHLKIGNKEFDATWKHLQSALNHFKVPQNLIGEVKQIFYSVEEDIVTIKQKTLFEKLGGEGAISAVVDKFYEFMMADPVVKDFFANVDMKNQAQMQKNFLGMVTGGPNKYTGKDMKAGHLHLKIGNKEFDATWKHLQSALNHFKVPQNLIGEVKQIFYSVEEDIVTIKQKTLFEKLGGEGAISAVVDKFYEFMMADPVVKDFFANVDMKNQAQMQKNFLGMVTGGPNKYTGKDMKAGHLHLKIGNKEFDATWKHLQSALNHFKVPQNLIGEVKQIFYSVEEDIVTIKQKTLFEKLGGEGAISAVVDKFYEFMMADPVVKDFFANVDMKNQAQMQKNFLGMVTGGPNKYTGKDMKAGHLHLKIGNKEFDATWKHLQSALNHFKVPQNLIGEVKQIFYSVEEDIVTIKQKTLFEKLGGEGAISAVVDKFYEFMMADPVVKDFFANVDMKNQAQMQKNFLGMVTGGPNKYTGKDMKAGHLHLKIGNKEFDATWKHLQSALNHFKVPQNLIGEVKQIFYSVEEDIVTIKQ